MDWNFCASIASAWNNAAIEAEDSYEAFSWLFFGNGEYI